jgi:5-methylcytosine-specific restriction endonuclease McrA
MGYVEKVKQQIDEYQKKNRELGERLEIYIQNPKPRKKANAKFVKKPTDSYEKYIHSTQWKLMREWLFHFRGKKCEQCNKTNNLNVHHLTYDHLYHEKPTDLIILCRECHKKAHNLK